MNKYLKKKKTPVKTLFLFDGTDESFFFELKGDYSKFNSVFLEDYDNNELVKELDKLLFNEGEFIHTKMDMPSKDWTHFVHIQGY